MTTTINMRDETMGGKLIQQISIDLGDISTTMTVRELIELRVRHEVKIWQNNQIAEFAGLVQPPNSHRYTNPDTSRSASRTVDADSQVSIALKAFEQNQMLILVNNDQCTDLSETVDVSFDTSISFVKLVLLVGG